jgi:hypothetical protein
MANTHLAIARLKASKQQAEKPSAAKAPVPPTIARSRGMSQLRSLKVSSSKD